MSSRRLTSQQLLKKARDIRDRRTPVRDLEEDLVIAINDGGGLASLSDPLIRKLRETVQVIGDMDLWSSLYHEEQRRREDGGCQPRKRRQPRLIDHSQPLLLEAQAQ